MTPDSSAMNCKTTKHRLCGVVLIVALTLLVVLPVQAVSANHGLRVVAVRGQVVAHVTRVETRISRTLSTRVLAPQRLRVAIIGADGSVRAAHVRVVGAAQLARGSARDAVLVTRLNAVAAPDDRLVVEWVTASL